MLSAVAVGVTTVSSTTSILYACVFREQTNAGYFSQITSGSIDGSSGTAAGTKQIPMSTTLVAGEQYALLFGGSGYTFTTITDYGPPRMYPTAGTYDPSGANGLNAQAWQSASLYIPVVNLATPAQNLGSFYWSDCNMSNGVGMAAVALQLRTV